MSSRGLGVPPDGSANGELLVVTGEASGEAHGAALVREVLAREPGLHVVAVGGRRMRAAGAELIYDYRELAVVGITEVIAHLGGIRRAMRSIQATVRERPIVGVVLVDYPDFNMMLARRLRRSYPDLPIVYYISPQVWAWRSGRVRTIARLVDRMLVILPFEQELYAEAGVLTEFVGHPLLDEPGNPESREKFAARACLDPSLHWVGLLPGSRAKEVERLFPAMLGAAERLASATNLEFVVPQAAGVEDSLYTRPLAALPEPMRSRVHLLANDYHALLPHLRVAAVCSGTATLEVAVAATPEVVVYRTSWLTYNLGKLLVRIPNIALVNVVAGRRGVSELLQDEVTPANIASQLRPLIDAGEPREECLRFLREVRDGLGEAGASGRAAAAVLAEVGAARPTTGQAGR